MRAEWVASSLALYLRSRCIQHTTITTADAQISAASSRLNWYPCQFKWTRPFRWKTKCGFCACGITFQTCCTEFKAEWIYKSYTFTECEGNTVLHTSVYFRPSHKGFIIFHCPSSLQFCIILHPPTNDFGSHTTVFLWLRPFNRVPQWSCHKSIGKTKTKNQMHKFRILSVHYFFGCCQHNFEVN